MNLLFRIVGYNHAVVYLGLIILINLAISPHGITTLSPATINPKLHLP